MNAIRNRPQLTPADKKGWYETMNNYGWSRPDTGPSGEQFTAHSSQSSLWSLDIGCGYGFQTAAAIKAGARVVANDLNQDHLSITASMVPAHLSLNLRTRKGHFNKISLPSGAFGAILAANVLHFMDGKTLEAASRKMFRLLAPGGKVFAHAQSPYISKCKEFIPVYEERKASGVKWPGVVEDWRREPIQYAMIGLFHFLDPETLSRGFAEAGFVIDEATYLAADLKDRKLDGRERVILVARKP